jgi:ABC-type (unclassified) transport system, ATPase component
MSVLSVKHLKKSYRTQAVVKDVSLTVHAGEIIGFLGPNGAGKTTSFHMIVGLIPCDSGTIHINEREIGGLPMDKRSHLGLGYLPQESSVFRRLTVEENIMAILQTRPQLTEAQRKRRLDNLLREFHISHLRDNLGMSLSGGEQRRVEIARTLATEPRFLLLDEPFAGIDPISINDIQRIARYLSQHGIGILITDHNVRESLGICDRAYIIYDGRIIAEGTPDVILENKQVREIYLGHQFNL